MTFSTPRRNSEGGTGPVPAVSVVMPVHNAMPFLDESVRSILDQTHRDFELVMLDDGSTDGSGQALREWRDRDPRIRLFESRTNLGPVGSSNLVVREARAPLIARMDADDIAHPDRLRRQLEIMSREPDIVLLGTLWVGIDEHGRTVRSGQRWRLTHRSPFNPFVHDSIMFRRADFDRIGGYRDQTDYWEDLELYWRFEKIGRVAVLPEVLVYVRFSGRNTRVTTDPERIENAVSLAFRCAHAHARGEDYEPIIQGKDRQRPKRVEPAVFTSIGGARVWAGRRPAVLSRMMRRMSFRSPLAATKVMIWAVWGTVSPGSLRWVMRGVSRLADSHAARRTEQGQLMEWRPGRARVIDRGESGADGQTPPRPDTPKTETQVYGK